MQDSIFQKIVDGEIPCHKLYEDEHTLAFLDVYPKNEGHTLVIPKVNPREFVWDLDDDTYQAVMTTAYKVARHLREQLPLPYVHMGVVGVDVPYAHVHLIPFASPTDLQGDQPAGDPDHEFLARLAAKLHLS